MTAPVRSPADLEGRRVTVLGLARSGVAAARMLADHGARVTVYDRREADVLAEEVAALGGRDVRLELGTDAEQVRSLLSASDLLVSSPSISPTFPTTEPWLREALAAAVEAGVELVSEVELFLRLTQARVLAVTGTKGKTTTTALLGAILEAGGVPHAVGGNIGTPLIERVDELGAADWAVLELSELQLPTISRGAEIAVYTNIGADHLDRHPSVEAYRAVKARLGELTAPRGHVVLNADDAGCLELGARLPAASLAWYGIGSERGHLAGSVDAGWLVVRGERVMAVADVPLRGAHLLADVLAAAVGASLAGVSAESIARGIRGFPGVPHRLEAVGELGGVRYVNDSQATIPMAALAALAAFDDDGLVLIAGGKDKGLDYAELGEAIAARCRAVVLIGETAGRLEALVGGRVPVHRAGSMDEAVRVAGRLARPGDVVLLSPAAASFDMFRDYAARGEAFTAAVRALGPGS
ncbi:MAG TPA: UDP-N-acetylmuramoyl-L-alanine--D-glutamate ligase [Candidatus Limnocylindria bacterium]